MKNFLYFLLGLIFVVGVSATTVSVMTIKPARPTSVVCFGSRFTKEIAKDIVKYTNQGYIVKTVSTFDNSIIGGDKIFVVMEKY